jgi:hypothetical protein
VSGQLYFRVKTPVTHWIRAWVCFRAGLDDVERIKISHLQGLELRTLCCSTGSQSLYRLRYLGTNIFKSILFVACKCGGSNFWYYELEYSPIICTFMCIVKILLYWMNVEYLLQLVDEPSTQHGEHLTSILLRDRRMKLCIVTWRTESVHLFRSVCIYRVILKSQVTCNRPWGPIGLWDVEAPTFSRKSAQKWRWGCQAYAPAAFYPQEDSWYSFLLEAESTPRS